MNKEQKILFPTDFSNAAFNALRNAILFTNQQEGPSRIQLLHVVVPESDVTDFPTLGSGAMMNRMEVAKTALEAFTETVLAQVQVDHVIDQLPVIESNIEIGLPTNTILNVAERDEVDLIIMGTQGEHSSLEKILGSTTSTTIRRAPCPVLVIPEHFRLKDIAQVAFATDFANTDPYYIWKMSRFLEAFHPVIKVVHIDVGSKKASGLPMEELVDFFSENVPGLAISFHNNPAKNVTEGLNDFVENNGIDLLVMHHQHRSLLDRIFNPSITKQLTFQTSSPILFFSE